MSTRRLAASVVLVVTGTGLAPAVAYATGSGTTLYVNNGSASCSDNGAGTSTVPFCTLQAGVDAATAGDTVEVAYGRYAPVTISNTGTAAAPITIERESTLHVAISASAGAVDFPPAFTINGASYVKISGFVNSYGGGQTAVVTNSHDVTLDDMQSPTLPDTAVPVVEVAGSSSNITVDRSVFTLNEPPHGSVIQLDPGTAGDVVSTNEIFYTSPNIATSYPAFISVNGAPNTAITNNTVDTGNACAPVVNVTGSAGGTAIENNIFTSPGAVCATGVAPVALVTATSTPYQPVTSDYNILFPLAHEPNVFNLYDWNGVQYGSPASLAAAGLGAHDLETNPQLTEYDTALQSTSPAIGSANAAAPGMLGVDFDGAACSYDPYVPITGSGSPAYCTRGAIQYQGAPLTATLTTQSVGALGVSLTDTNPPADGTYSIAWGDGSTSPSSTTNTTTHTYTAPGTHTVTETVTDQLGGTTTATTTFTTNALSGGHLFDNNRSASGAWWAKWDQGPANSADIAQASATAMPNNDLQMVAVTGGGTLEHSVYNGSTRTWQNWGVPANNATPVSAAIAGMRDGSSQLIEVTSSGALEHDVRYANGSWQPYGWGVPAGSTGIAQASITAMPDGSTQLVAVTTSGSLEHNIRGANGVWQGWRVLNQPGVKVVDASIAGMRNGSSQIIEVTSTGVMKHDIRNGNGTWQPQGWSVPAGSTGIAQASITAMPDGSTQFAAVTTSGVLEHNLRSANGTWQPNSWAAPTQTDLAAGATSPSIAGLPNGSSQIIEVSTN